MGISRIKFLSSTWGFGFINVDIMKELGAGSGIDITTLSYESKPKVVSTDIVIYEELPQKQIVESNNIDTTITKMVRQSDWDELKINKLRILEYHVPYLLIKYFTLITVLFILDSM